MEKEQNNCNPSYPYVGTVIYTEIELPNRFMALCDLFFFRKSVLFFRKIQTGSLLCKVDDIVASLWICIEAIPTARKIQSLATLLVYNEKGILKVPQHEINQVSAVSATRN